MTVCIEALVAFVGYPFAFANQKNRPGRPPRVPPSEEPRELKKPLGREALARALSNSAGMPRGGPWGIVATPERPGGAFTAGISRRRAGLLNAGALCRARVPSGTLSLRARPPPSPAEPA